MPTTLTGLLLFLVLLLPGFAYLVGKERHGVERRPSAFRETVAIVAASVATELLVLAVTAPAWASTLDTHALVNNPRDHLPAIAGWGISVLTAATLIAYLWSWPRPRRWIGRRMEKRLTGRLAWINEAVGTGFPHPSTVSAWWTLFEQRRQQLRDEYGADPVIEVGCYLDDGSYIAGGLNHSSQLADDTPDRDLILASPMQRPSGRTALEPMNADAACISARRIVTLVVKYYAPPPDSVPGGVGAGTGGDVG